MPTLKQLTPEMTEALGKTQGLIKRYEDLLAKSKSESLRDNKDTVTYIDDVVKRYKSIKATNPSKEELKIKKGTYLLQLKQHVAEASVASFSKPTDVAIRLQEVDFAAESIDQIVKGMEQAGGNNDDLATLLTSLVTSETFLAFCSDGGHHHHHHHGFGGGHHHHW